IPRPFSIHGWLLDYHAIMIALSRRVYYNTPLFFFFLYTVASQAGSSYPCSKIIYTYFSLWGVFNLLLFG
ncbi:hypothetical protein BJX99DRAFT_234464, partial [Aspergillus californicus]